MMRTNKETLSVPEQEKQPRQSLTITNTDQLEEVLDEAGIDHDEWGAGQAKTLDQLFGEIQEGETEIIRQGGEVYRATYIAKGDVYFTNKDGDRFRLKEDRQEFKDGRVRRRSHGPAVAEKFKPSEDPEEAMIRGIQEELGIDGDVHTESREKRTEIKDSRSYPGLHSQYVLYPFEIELSEDQFDPNGYVEEQEDKSTFFTWEEV